jgi:ABC-type lipoprotein export system ATPase subunit
MNDGNAPRISMRSVEKTYGGRGIEPVHALQGVSLELAPGEFIAVEGPSGCGKTSLLNLLGLIDTPSAGEILWNGERVDRLHERERSRRRLSEVGFVFQRFHLIPTMTAQENVELPMRAARVPRADRRRRSAELLGRVGLASRASAYPHQLSGGEEQRVAIARSLANGPHLLLADEPTGELDSANAQQVLGLLTELHRQSGASLVLVTHNPAIASAAGRRIQMSDGRVIANPGT